MSFIGLICCTLLIAGCSDSSVGTTGGSGAPVVKTPDGRLVADGNDAKTYSLIVSSGYNYETPDKSGEHAKEPFRHIRQRYDEELGRHVFDFYLHLQNDDDRGKANITDRQRNEIKTDAKSPSFMYAVDGETLKIEWLFRLPEGMKTTTKFSHIHQLKGIDNESGTADVSQPILTFTVRSVSGGQQFQIIHNGPSPSSSETLLKTDLAPFLGQWVKVTETVCFAKDGSYSVLVERVSDGRQLARLEGVQRDFRRDGTPGYRPKWGLYRYFGKNRSLGDQLRDEILSFADFSIIKL
ncbi:MAG: hypothetical protein IJ799_00010 [Bacteroidales bacterium]|nr:hypothetical protein [Bacteroidales bacterium]